MAICTIQVTNICPKATHRQMKELFSYFGDIDEIRLFPENDNRHDIPSKVCFVAYKERSSVETALHLSNTVFIDRSLIVAQSRFEIIPDESLAMSLAAPAVAVAFIDKNSLAGSGVNSTPLLPTPQTSLLGTPQMLPNPLASAFQQAQAVASSITANIQSQDDKDPFSAAASAAGVIPSVPPITGNVDPSKIDEIKRTIYVGNLSSTLHADQVMNFFQTCGEIRYVRMAGDETQPTRFAFVEFTNPESVQVALQYNGAMFGDRPIKVNHSKNAIVKPQGKAPDVAQREVDEAMRKVRQANHSITNEIEPGSKEDKRRSRSKSRSRSRERRREKRRHRSPTPPPRDNRRKRRSHSRSPPPRFRRGRRSRSRSPPPPRQYHSHHHRSSYHRYRSPDRDRDRDRGDRGDRERDRDRDRERKRYTRSRSRTRSPSPRHSRHSHGGRRDRGRERDYSPSPSPSPERRRDKRSRKEKKEYRRKSPSPSHSPSPPPTKEDGGGSPEEEFSMSDEDEEEEGHSTPPSGSE